MSFLTGWLKPKEHEWLSGQARKCKRVLEVGSYHGKSTTALLNADKVWCVDLWGTKAVGEKDYRRFIKNMKPYMSQLEIMRGDSHAMLDRLLGSVTGFFDMAFIDGCHRYKFVYGDILRCKKLVRPGGILCGHDYNERMWPGVVQAVNELAPMFSKVEGTALWWMIV